MSLSILQTTDTFAMETGFSISFNIRTGSGMETYGVFYVGSDKERAYRIFRQLKGSNNVSEASILTIDFIERKDGIPVNLEMHTCTLEELADNIKIITREVFKALGIEG